MKTRFPQIIILLLVFCLFISTCARDQLFLTVEITEQLVIEDIPDTGKIKAETSAELTVTKIDTASTSSLDHPFTVDLLVSLKAVLSSGEGVVEEIQCETIELNDAYSNPFVFTIEGDKEVLEHGTYWLEYIWIDDGGYHLVETEEAVYE